MSLLHRREVVDLTAAEEEEAAEVSAWLGQVAAAADAPHDDELAAWVDRMKYEPPKKSGVNRPAPNPWKWQWSREGQPPG